MKKYNNRGYNYRPNQRRKRIRINKKRFTIFVLSCLVILLGVGFGVKALLTDKVDVNISMTDDLNSVEGESLFKVLLSWNPLPVEDYKHIQIKVNDKEYILEPDKIKEDLIESYKSKTRNDMRNIAKLLELNTDEEDSAEDIRRKVINYIMKEKISKNNSHKN